MASELVLDAERALKMLTDGGDTAAPCGPDGMLTYVEPKAIQSRNAGYCYKVVGWQKIGVSADGRKILLWKPIELAGIAACGVTAP